ncbi:MAG: hypothetical protein KC503_08700 [Myxococcales bacterium]|nr:hypothetical protein [Myxococcales bacterium]
MVVLINALRTTAARLSRGARYQWTHMGACNCGHLAQTVTKRSRAEIHEAALEKAGDWGEQVIDHCPQSGYPIDHIITALLALGLTRADLAALERLADPAIRRRIDLAALGLDSLEQLSHRRREHVVAYMNAWADLLESRAVQTYRSADAA